MATRPEKEKELVFTIDLCQNEAINGEYRNNLPSTNDNKQSLHVFLSKNINILLDDSNNNYHINELHIFTHQLFDTSNGANNYILFLCQHKLSVLKNTWYIAKYNGTDKNIDLLYFVNDKVSSEHYFAPKIRWKPYNDKEKDVITIHTFDTKEINLDEHLFVFNNQYKDDNEYWTRDNLDRSVMKKYNRRDNDNDNDNDNKHQRWKESNFDNIYFQQIRDAAIEDVRWFSNAHSWYKHLPIVGRKYVIYPDYNGMTRGYGGGPRYEKQIRWHMTYKQDIYEIFQKDVRKIIKKYCRDGKIQFNRAYCGVNRCKVNGDNEYGQNRYPKCKIFKSEHTFTLIESDNQIENAVRSAFMIYDEIIELFDYWKYCVLSYWLRVNKIDYIVKEIKSIIHRYILLEYEHYAFIKRDIFNWDTFDTKRYFKRLYKGFKIGGFTEEAIVCIDKLWNDYWIYGDDLPKITEEYLIKSKMENKNDRKLFLEQISNFYDGNTMIKYIQNISSRHRDLEIKNKEEIKITNFAALNLDIFREKGNDNDFYKNLNIKNDEVIEKLIKIHKFITKPLRVKKSGDWY